MTEKQSFLRENGRYIIIFAAASVFTLFYLLPPYNVDIINYDSAYQYFLTRHSLAEIWELIPTDYSPPLYAILLKLWTMVFGETLAAMRAFALVPLMGMNLLAAFPIRKAFGGTASVLCTIFFTLSTVNFTIIPETRPATLAYFLVTAAAVYCYLALFQDCRYGYICFTVFSILAMYTHNIAMLSALAFYISAFFVAIVQKKYRHAIKFVISGVISAVCYIPWLFVVLAQFANVQNHYWSSSDITPGMIYDWTIGVNFDDGCTQILSRIIVPAAALIAIVSVFSVKANREKVMSIKSLSDANKMITGRFKEPYAKAVFLLLTYVAPILALLAFSLIAHPIIVPRYFYIFCGTAMIIIAAAFAQLSQLSQYSQSGGKAAFAVLSVIVAANFSVHAVTLKNEIESSDFPEMIEYIRESAPESEIAFIHPHEWTLGVMLYYFPEAKHYISDDTWYVLTTFDVFPADIVNVSEYAGIAEYENSVFLFDDINNRKECSVSSEYEDSGLFEVEEIGMFSDPYTLKQKWRLLNVSVKDQGLP